MGVQTLVSHVPALHTSDAYAWRLREAIPPPYTISFIHFNGSLIFEMWAYLHGRTERDCKACWGEMPTLCASYGRRVKTGAEGLFATSDALPTRTSAAV